MNEYLINLKAFKTLIESYTIADLKSMIYDIKAKPSGACCYPAVQALFSLMELIGKLIAPNTMAEQAFVATFTKLADKYKNQALATKLYSYFRHGIAHNSLAKGGVRVKKLGDSAFHLSENGNNIDIKILFEDFIPIFNDIFDNQLQNGNYILEYERRLRSVFKELKIDWINSTQQWGGLDVSADYTRTDVSTSSGMQLPKAQDSGASVTELKLNNRK
jgi:hypothetical protein